MWESLIEINISPSPQHTVSDFKYWEVGKYARISFGVIHVKREEKGGGEKGET